MTDDTFAPIERPCPNCGRIETRPEVRICPNCGAMLPGSQPVPLAPPILGPQAQAQAERPHTPEPPHQPWAVLPDNVPTATNRDRDKPSMIRGCVTVLLWIVGGFFVLIGLLILGILLFCSGIKP